MVVKKYHIFSWQPQFLTKIAPFVSSDVLSAKPYFECRSTCAADSKDRGVLIIVLRVQFLIILNSGLPWRGRCAVGAELVV